MPRSSGRFKDDVIPFYGASDPAMFEIERRCMDREGLLVRFLDSILPSGRVLDVGAGDGFTAERLNVGGRTVVAMEPDPGMVSSSRKLVWASGVAQDIPFHDDSFDGAYSTWAFFLSGTAVHDRGIGLRELGRVVRPGGPIAIADNAGGDEFCSLSERRIHGDASWWTRQGFEKHLVETSFRFDSIEEARRLLAFYFGSGVLDRVRSADIGFNIAVYVGSSGEVTP